MAIVATEAYAPESASQVKSRLREGAEDSPWKLVQETSEGFLFLGPRLRRQLWRLRLATLVEAGEKGTGSRVRFVVWDVGGGTESGLDMASVSFGKEFGVFGPEESLSCSGDRPLIADSPAQPWFVRWSRAISARGRWWLLVLVAIIIGQNFWGGLLLVVAGLAWLGLLLIDVTPRLSLHLRSGAGLWSYILVNTAIIAGIVSVWFLLE